MDDTLLLRRYAEGQDAEAFAELVRRYAGMVYGTCLRITRNAHDAEDVVQESFLELARRAGSVQKPGPWLHGVAANKARNVVRDAVTRNRHEEQVMTEIHGEPTWEELAPHVDRAIEELPDELRDVVVQHFLRGQTQAQAAEILGVNQSTVSRQLEQAVQQLREALRKGGVVASVAVLGTLLTQNASAAVPAALTAVLGKMAVAGVSKAAAGTTAGVLSTVGGKVAVVIAAAAAVIVTGVVLSQHTAKPPPPPPAIVSATATNSSNGGTDVNQEKNARPAAIRPDYSKLELKGDDHAKDSFSLTLQAVARMYGIDVDYETVYGLSGNGFAPGIHPPEDCRQLQRMHDRGQCLDIVAARLGLVLRPLDLDYRRNQKPWLAIREALDHREVVITSCGWLDAPYTWWGIILEAPENGPVNAMRGATQNGRKDTRLNHTAKTCWAVTLGKPTMTPEQADIAMLQRAVARIRGDKEPFLLGDDQVVYGLKAMDLWIADMKKPAFQPDDPASSMGNAACCALYTSEGARDTCLYLRRRLATFPEAMRTHIDAAAAQYDFIWRALAPFSVYPGGYAAVIGDQARQIEHADKVLVPCKEAMAKAADEIEKALAAARPRPDYSKLDLKGRDWHDDSFSIVMREVARLHGHEADYTTIFALSGNAFSPSWVTDKEFCRATGRMFGKEKNIDMVARFLGLNARKLVLPEPLPTPQPDPQGRTWGTPPFKEWVRNRNAECAAVIRKALEAGETVVTSGGWRNHEWFVWGIITEAQPDGTITGETISSPLDGNVGHCFMDHIRDYWAITPAPERLPQKEADLALLRSVVQSLSGAPPYEPGWVVYGLQAMDMWIAQMSKPSFQEDSPASSAGNAGINADASAQGAEVAAEYLRQRMGTFPEPMWPHLEAAAEHYANITELLRPFAVPPKDGKGYSAITGDLAKQKAHAENVLKPVKAELAAAADEMEKAIESVRGD